MNRCKPKLNRKKYKKPELIDYGTVRSLTTGGSTGKKEDKGGRES